MSELNPELVERVAEALRVACHDEFGTYWKYGVAQQFARVAIRAMREPTEAMLQAAQSPAPEISAEWREYARNDWILMVDAALKEHRD